MSVNDNFQTRLFSYCKNCCEHKWSLNKDGLCEMCSDEENEPLELEDRLNKLLEETDGRIQGADSITPSTK